MNKKTIRIIAILAAIGLIYVIFKKYPDQLVLGIGIAIILVIGSWLIDIEKD